MKLTACSKAHALSLTKRHSKYNTHCKESNSFHSFFHQVEIICNRLMLPRYTEGYKPKWKWFTPCDTAWIKLITHLLDYYLLRESSVMWLYPHRQHHGSTEWLSYIWTLCREQNLVLSSFPPPRQMLMHLDKTPLQVFFLPGWTVPTLSASPSIPYASVFTFMAPRWAHSSMPNACTPAVASPGLSEEKRGHLSWSTGNVLPDVTQEAFGFPSHKDTLHALVHIDPCDRPLVTSL